MKNNFNTICEGIFKAASQDELLKRKLDYEYTLSAKNIKNKELIESKFGPLEESDIIYFKKYHRYYTIINFSHAPLEIKSDLSENTFMGPCFIIDEIMRFTIGSKKYHHFLKYPLICSYESLDLNEIEIIHKKDPKYFELLGKFDDSNYNKENQKYYKQDFRN